MNYFTIYNENDSNWFGYTWIENNHIQVGLNFMSKKYDSTLPNKMCVYALNHVYLLAFKLYINTDN